MSMLRLALPSKGREDETLRFLGQCGLSVDRSNPRQYRARMRGLPTGAEVVFQRATDIFDKVDEGSVDLGITGYDIVAEHRSEEDEIVVVHPELGFRRCALVLAVPEGWLDVTSVSDLAEVAVELRSAGPRAARGDQVRQSRRGSSCTTAASPTSTSSSQGAIEAAPALETADVICDLTSSGVTLRENRLKTMSAGRRRVAGLSDRQSPRAAADASRLEATRGDAGADRGLSALAPAGVAHGQHSRRVGRSGGASGHGQRRRARPARANDRARVTQRSPDGGDATGMRSSSSSARTCCCRRWSPCAGRAPARSPRPRCATSSSTARGRSRPSSASSAPPLSRSRLRPRQLARKNDRLLVLIVDAPPGLAAQVRDQVRLRCQAEQRI